MRLPLTSLVPTVVEIAAFIEQNWPRIWWFPNWYLGVPLRFVTGPLIPALVILLRRLTGAAMADVYLGLIGGMWVIGGIGVKVLVGELGGGKRSQFWAAGLFLLLPFHLLLLSYGNGLHHIATVLLPWVFWSWFRSVGMVGNGSRVKRISETGTIIVAALVLLVDISGFLPLLIGGAVIIFMGNRKDWGIRAMKSIFILLTAISLATIWYTPRFWWILFGNPSFGGKPLANVISFILQLVQALIPLILGIFVVQKRYRSTDKVIRFGMLFGSSFLFLTLIRFLSDVDFWMDWTGYFLELQLTFALIGGLLFSRYIKKRLVIFFIISMLTISDGIVLLGWYNSDKTNWTYKEQIKKVIGEHVAPGERVFLSGSPVFWVGGEFFAGPAARVTRSSSVASDDIGSLFQVRGGRDEVSPHPTWAMGAYQIREGIDAAQLKDWLTALGVSYVLVHQEGSRDYFQDFKNIARFETLVKEAEFEGNVLYRSPGSVARLADKKILESVKLQGGGDRAALSEYAGYLKGKVDMRFTAPTAIEISPPIELKKDEIISFAMTYDPAWKLSGGGGRTVEDGLGNLAVEPAGEGRDLSLKYEESVGSWLPGVMLTLLTLFLLNKAEAITHYFTSRVPGLSLIDAVNEEVEY